MVLETLVFAVFCSVFSCMTAVPVLTCYATLCIYLDFRITMNALYIFSSLITLDPFANPLYSTVFFSSYFLLVIQTVFALSSAISVMPNSR